MGKHSAIRHHPITPKRVTYGVLAGGIITASLGIVPAAFAHPTSDDTAPLAQADWIPMPEKDTETKVADIPFDPATMTPPSAGDDQAKYDAWVAAGMPGHVAEAGESKGIDSEAQAPLEDAKPTTPAPVDPSGVLAIPHDWSGVADCESSGNWQANTGSGYYGGLQFSQGTWDYEGGQEFADRADHATPYQQQVVAERTLNDQGQGAWPTCGKFLTDAGGSTDPAPVAESVGQRAVDIAMQYLGWDYVWGGSSPADGGFDCSGIIYYSYGQLGVPVPRTTWDQLNAGYSVGYDELLPGDIVIASGGGHVVLYVGDGQVLQFQQPGTQGMLTPLSDILNWYGPLDARRLA